MVITTDGQWAVLGSLSELQGISRNGTIGRIKTPGDSTPSRHGLASTGQGHQEPPLLPRLPSVFQESRNPVVCVSQKGRTSSAPETGGR